MQVSERFRRGVVVPLDDISAKAMADADIDELTRVHFVEIPTQSEFESIWETGIFDEINGQTGSMLDDYEEDVIPVEMIPRLRAILYSYTKMQTSEAAKRFFDALLEVCDLALDSSMPIYFIL